MLPPLPKRQYAFYKWTARITTGFMYVILILTIAAFAAGSHELTSLIMLILAYFLSSVLQYQRRLVGLRYRGTCLDRSKDTLNSAIHPLNEASQSIMSRVIQGANLTEKEIDRIKSVLIDVNLHLNRLGYLSEANQVAIAYNQLPPPSTDSVTLATYTTRLVGITMLLMIAFSESLAAIDQAKIELN